MNSGGDSVMTFDRASHDAQELRIPHPEKSMDAITTLLVVSVCLAIVGALPLGAQETSAALPEAADVLDQADAKSGDLAARKALRSLVIKGSIAAKGMPAKGTFTHAFLGADRAMLTVAFGAFGTSTEGTDGTVSWSTDPSFGVTIREGDEQASVLRHYAIVRRADWRSIYARAVCTGRVDVEGRPCFELEMHPKAGAPDKWFIDVADRTLTRVDLKLPNPTGGDLSVRFLFGDWKKAGDIMFPFTKRMKAGIYELTYACETITPNADVAPEMVAPPEKVKQAIADPSKRTKRPPEKGDESKIETVKAQPVAFIRTITKASDVSKTLAVVLPEVFTHLAKIGGGPAGPPYTRYHRIDGETIDLEAGLPVSAPIKSEGRVVAGELPGGKMATAWHIGPYDKLPDTYKRLEEWMTKNGHKSAGAFWEIYWTDPGIESDSTKWRTQILWPVQ
jgi:effector-binding domain-containing protein